jgi:hypothetical protein
MSMLIVVTLLLTTHTLFPASAPTVDELDRTVICAHVRQSKYERKQKRRAVLVAVLGVRELATIAADYCGEFAPWNIADALLVIRTFGFRALLGQGCSAAPKTTYYDFRDMGLESLDGIEILKNQDDVWWKRMFGMRRMQPTRIDVSNNNLTDVPHSVLSSFNVINAYNNPISQEAVYKLHSAWETKAIQSSGEDEFRLLLDLGSYCGTRTDLIIAWRKGHVPILPI